MTSACAADMAPDAPESWVAATASDLAARGFHIHKSQSANCLVSRSGAGERPVQQTPCAGFSDQDWDFPTRDNVNFQIHNLDRNQCIVTRGRNVESLAVTTTCDTRFNDQLWRILVDDGTGALKFVNVNSGRCLAARSNSQAVQVNCGNFSDQKWFVE